LLENTWAKVVILASKQKLKNRLRFIGLIF
jgi:hypothetical protein